MGQPATLEQTLISIVRTLPPERAVELLDFARFLQTLDARSDTEDQWDQLFAKPEAQRAMLEMAREAREEFQAGRATDITITDDGRLAPK
ncbi:MAG: hypothetical protein HY868_05260 [Chloroflexi bacterium]|nr:hypothetical protein [Chloroflexota bacterium]